MKLRRTLSEPEEPIELNLIPLIDVIIFLLIFFISTTSFMDQPGVTMDKPHAGGSSQGQHNSIVFAVTSEGKIIHDGREIGLGGVRATEKILCPDEARPVVIQASQNSHAGVGIRVIDEAKHG